MVVDVQAGRRLSDIDGGMAVVFAGSIERGDDSAGQYAGITFYCSAFLPIGGGRKRRANLFYI